MDATAWVAVAGITGTVLAPLILEQMRRGSARREHLLRARLDVYADLLMATARLADNAQTWSALPLADLRETDDATLDRVLARVEVLGSDAVYGLMRQVKVTANEFNRMLWSARIEADRVRREEAVDDVQLLRSRIDAGVPADRLMRLHLQLRSTIRAELHTPLAARLQRLLGPVPATRPGPKPSDDDTADTSSTQ